MSDKEATARIKINRLLESAGWRFFPDGTNPANVRLEPAIAIRSVELDALGENFEKAAKGFVDFLLLDARGFPLIILEAKAEGPGQGHFSPFDSAEKVWLYTRGSAWRCTWRGHVT